MSKKVWKTFVFFFSITNCTIEKKCSNILYIGSIKIFFLILKNFRATGFFKIALYKKKFLIYSLGNQYFWKQMTTSFFAENFRSIKYPLIFFYALWVILWTFFFYFSVFSNVSFLKIRNRARGCYKVFWGLKLKIKWYSGIIKNVSKFWTRFADFGTMYLFHLLENLSSNVFSNKFIC